MGERALVLPWHKLPGLGRISDGICDRRSAISYQRVAYQRTAISATRTLHRTAISYQPLADR
ncbi:MULTISPECIES: hypothetical protein [Moorena]|uniref:Uncharacterized protein n=1 Tax=Moorena producens (strain JHB) TaxID=1454205 RepID=A0A1D9FWH2_MOOP1|nr:MULTISPECIES: hypothetical protein [Moorena]NEQ13231.1 hypothetical protein [Moorena sp. SIO3E2]AOY79697.1 hypothetical protein BJP36_06920 [Moorena producens JHB]NEQ09869.1 hypothetical protein [Moorena sp. SIO4E2]NER88030.1 hypothetical protein [Moorena sp. SIO3A2]NES45725.1 hypothetical protein [Moorena sp. SIO2C4]